MDEYDLKSLYFEWMCDYVVDRNKKSSYIKLLEHLNNVEFVYILPMDGNRAEDGIDLRYRFGYECSYDDRTISKYLDNSPCSILEMMIALSIRIEEHIMEDETFGNRTKHWFWSMINSLKLWFMDDDRYDPEYVDLVLYIFLNREYEPDGNGGLFTIKNCNKDLRQVDIWYQMCWYLNDFV